MVTNRTYTVKQAAVLLGVHEMTVRRLASSGTVPATRAGRTWLLDAAAIDKRAGAAAPSNPPRPRLDIERALRQVLEAREREWIPDPLGFQDVRSRPTPLIEKVAQRWERNETDGNPYEVIPVPKTALLCRPGARLSLDDEVLFQSLVLKAAPRIAAALSPAALGYRPAARGVHLLQKGDAAWKQYQRILRDAPNHWRFALKTDIAAYFEQIKIPVLRDTLLNLGIQKEIVGGVQGLLTGWERTTGFSGLPQGGDAARVLANIYLLPADDAMEAAARANGWRYIRWMDDITVFSSDAEALRRAAFVLETELRRLGLNLSSAKTLVESVEVLAQGAADPILNRIDYDFRMKRFVDVRRDAWPVLRKATGNLRHLHPRDRSALRFSLYRLGEAGDERAVPFIIRNLDDAGFLADFVYLYLRHFSTTASVVTGIGQFLSVADPNQDAYLAAHLLRVVYRAAALDRQTLEHVRNLAWSPTLPPSARAIAIRVVGRHAEPADVPRLRTSLWTEPHDVCVRALLAALREADPRGHRSTFGDFRRIQLRFSATVAFLMDSPAPPLG